MYQCVFRRVKPLQLVTENFGAFMSAKRKKKKATNVHIGDYNPSERPQKAPVVLLLSFIIGCQINEILELMTISVFAFIFS